MSLQFEKVAGPFSGLTGGVLWDGKSVLFSAVKEEKIYQFNPGNGKTDIFRRWTGRTNGLAQGRDGSLYGAQEGGRRVIQFNPDGSTSPTLDMIDGWHHNQPTDLVVDSRARVWFADSRSDVLPYGPGLFPYMKINGVLRLERDESRAWKLVQVINDTLFPRALVFSADEKTLYVADGDSSQGHAVTLCAYPLAEQDQIGKARILYTMPEGERGFEGLCLDKAGNLLACGGSSARGGGPRLMVFSASGSVLHSFTTPDMPMRCALGGDDLGSLYLTSADGHLYRAPYRL